MDKIREAFESKLNEKKLDEQSKQAILRNSERAKFRYVPAVTFIVAVLSIFFAWNVWQTGSIELSDEVSTEYMDVKDLEQSILQYTNELLAADANDKFYMNVGESYSLRLALEQNSGLFYSDIDLTKDEQLLLSEFLHYLQEAHMLQLVLNQEQVASLEELLQEAPAFIAYWDEMLQSYKPIHEEQKNPKIAALNLWDWVGILFALSVSIFVIIRLWRNHYRVPPIVWACIVVLVLGGLFIRPDGIAYDETSMVKIIEEQLIDANIRLVGEPTVDVLTGTSMSRYMLLSYDDGLEVLGTFQQENGFFYYQNMSWGGSRTFFEPGQFQNKHIMTFIVPKSFKESHVQLSIDGNVIEFEVPKGEASAFMVRANDIE